MNTITQTMKFRQAIIEFSLKHGVIKAAIRYKTNRQYTYRRRKRYGRATYAAMLCTFALFFAVDTKM